MDTAENYQQRHDAEKKRSIAKELDYLRARLAVAQKYDDQAELRHLLTVRHVLAQGLRKMAETEGEATP